MCIYPGILSHDRKMLHLVAYHAERGRLQREIEELAKGMRVNRRRYLSNRRSAQNPALSPEIRRMFTRCACKWAAWTGADLREMRKLAAQYNALKTPIV